MADDEYALAIRRLDEATEWFAKSLADMGTPRNYEQVSPIVSYASSLTSIAAARQLLLERRAEQN
jgi:hypothetical protein